MTFPPHPAVAEFADGHAILLAGPLDPILNWMQQWQSQFQLGGIIILACAAILLGVKTGTKSAVSSNNNGMRDTLSSASGVAIGAIIVGAALFLIPLMAKAGQDSGTTPAPTPPPTQEAIASQPMVAVLVMRTV